MESKFPYLEFVYPGLQDIEKRPGRRLIKTHLPSHLLPESIQESGAKVRHTFSRVSVCVCLDEDCDYV